MTPASMRARVVPAKRSDRRLLRRLLEIYQYELSQYDGLDMGPDGLYGYGRHHGYSWLDWYWKDPSFHPFLIYAEGDAAAQTTGPGRLAGFAFVNSIPEAERETDFTVAEFFILYNYRRRGVGRAAAFWLFGRFRGRWQLRRHPRNGPAARFWNNVVGGYTGGQYLLLEGQSARPYADGVFGDVYCFKS